MLQVTVQSEPEQDATCSDQLVGAPSQVHEDLASHPIQLNEHLQVTVDGMQWMLCKRTAQR